MPSTAMFLIYLGALVFMVLGGFMGLIQSQGNPGFLVPILFGLMFFWALWEITVGSADKSKAARD
ncbi:MAG TPA: hypothetical protein QGF35_02845 [Dehalococcoidia bacterium]|nr:hypothetical protein [Dehalococcoidia bacterium]